MLEMCGKTAIAGDRGPSVFEDADCMTLFVDHRLYGKDHPRLQTNPLPGRSVIGNLGVFMELSAYPVPHELPYYRISS